jgi:hypothetical protein
LGVKLQIPHRECQINHEKSKKAENEDPSLREARYRVNGFGEQKE